MRVRIKVCGITTPEAAVAASELGVDAVGFVFFAESPRHLVAERAMELVSYLSPLVTRVAVFRHPRSSEIAEVVSRLCPQVIQAEPAAEVSAAIPSHILHLPVFHDGSDLGERVAKFVAHAGNDATVVLEASGRGGRGLAPNWTRAAEMARSVRLVLAGGLTPDNVAEAIRSVRPYAVDVSSGVETKPGVKDPKLIEEFVTAVRDAQDHPAAIVETSP
ncbi:MAG: phosphoribosylanthranilate isomerase [Gemmatimonadetes bacterium]|nr:phosphoribosylanthranilate isomerase [Gemmatimonadota bacterium]MCH8938020.1 phosphoribosylanthranilate isomerase [Gemmatimonadota bacterium]